MRYPGSSAWSVQATELEKWSASGKVGLIYPAIWIAEEPVMRLFNVLRNILKTMGRKEMYVFIDGTSLCDPEWLAVGPHEDPHTYPTLEQLAFYQADPILERGSKVYLLFPVPDEVLRPILEKYEADRE